MLDDIRIHMMDIIYLMKVNGSSWVNEVCLAIKDLINKMMVDHRFWHVFLSGLNYIETRSLREAFKVDLDKKHAHVGYGN